MISGSGTEVLCGNYFWGGIIIGHKRNIQIWGTIIIHKIFLKQSDILILLNSLTEIPSYLLLPKITWHNKNFATATPIINATEVPILKHPLFVTEYFSSARSYSQICL